MRESRTPGSVRGVLSNEHPYRDSSTLINPSANAQNGDLYPVAGLLQTENGDWWREFRGSRKKKGRGPPWGRIRFLGFLQNAPKRFTPGSRRQQAVSVRFGFQIPERFRPH